MSLTRDHYPHPEKVMLLKLSKGVIIYQRKDAMPRSKYQWIIEHSASAPQMTSHLKRLKSLFNECKQTGV